MHPVKSHLKRHISVSITSPYDSCHFVRFKILKKVGIRNLPRSPFSLFAKKTINFEHKLRQRGKYLIGGVVDQWSSPWSTPTGFALRIIDWRCCPLPTTNTFALRIFNERGLPISIHFNVPEKTESSNCSGKSDTQLAAEFRALFFACISRISRRAVNHKVHVIIIIYCLLCPLAVEAKIDFHQKLPYKAGPRVIGYETKSKRTRGGPWTHAFTRMVKTSPCNLPKALDFKPNFTTDFQV